MKVGAFISLSITLSLYEGNIFSGIKFNSYFRVSRCENKCLILIIQHPNFLIRNNRKYIIQVIRKFIITTT